LPKTRNPKHLFVAVPQKPKDIMTLRVQARPGELSGALSLGTGRCVRCGIPVVR